MGVNEFSGDRRRIRPSAAVQVLCVLFLVAAGGCAGSGRATDGRPGEYVFWPPFPNEPRMQYLSSYRFSEDVEPPRSAMDEMLFGKGRRVLPIIKPYGLEMWNGRIYVCDTKSAGVFVLDLRAKETRLMGVSGMGRLTSPTDIAIADDGMKYVSDAQRGYVALFDADERYVTKFGFPDFKPTGVAVYGDELFTCDFESKRIIVFDRRTGERRRDIGGGEEGDPEVMAWPLGIDVDPRGNLRVSDVLQCKVRTFSRDGALLDTFGQVGTNFGSFVRPKHVAVDEEGVVYVVDAAFQNVQMFSRDNELLMHFGSAGAFPGAMQLPAGVCVHQGDLDLFEELIHPAFEARRLVLVTNQFGVNKVSVYAMGALREGMTPQDIAGSVIQINPGTAEEGAGDSLAGEQTELPAEDLEPIAPLPGPESGVEDQP